MWTSKPILLVAACAIIITTGCGEFDPLADRPAVYPLGVDGQRFFYEHYANYSDYGDVPSSIWVLDLDGGQSRQVGDPRTRYDTQCSGDYCVFAKPVGGEPDNEVDSLVGFQISKAEPFTIVEEMSPPAYSFSLDGTRVAFPSKDDALIVYDLEARDTVQVIPLGVSGPDETPQLGQFVDHQAVIFRWILPELPEEQDDFDQSLDEFEFVFEMALVDLTTEQVTGLPRTPEDWVPLYPVPALSDDWIVLSGMPNVMDIEAGWISEILAYHIPTGEWNSVTSYEPVDVLGTSIGAAVVAGLYGDEAVTFRFPDESFGWSTELVNLGTGAARVIATGGIQTLFGPGDCGPLVHDDRVYWIDTVSTRLVVYDLSTDTQRTIPLDYPGKN